MEKDPPEIRSRTDAFLKLRNSYRTSGKAVGAPAEAKETSPEPKARPGWLPPWIRALSEFTELEKIIKKKIDALAESQRDFFKPRFVSDEEEQGMQHKVEKQADEIQRLLRELDRMVQVSMVPQDKNNEEEQMISVNAKRLLSAELQKLIQAFKSGQEYYGNGLKSRERKLKKYTKIGTDAAYEEVKQEERVSRFMAMGYTDADIQELLLEEALEEDASTEIKAILDSVKELNEMFQDLHELVVEQGTMLDRIDYNLQQSLVHTTKAVKELKKAEEHQEASTCTMM